MKLLSSGNLNDFEIGIRILFEKLNHDEKLLCKFLNDNRYFIKFFPVIKTNEYEIFLSDEEFSYYHIHSPRIEFYGHPKIDLRDE